MKINWKIRFSKDNISFIFRFLLSILMPILIYFGLETKDLTSWNIIWEVFVKAISNPYLVGLTIVNAVNVLIDPTTKGLSDSEKALSYTAPKNNAIEAEKITEESK